MTREPTTQDEGAMVMTPRGAGGGEREAMIAYLIGTQALADFTVSREDAEAAVDEAYRLPLVNLTPAHAGDDDERED